MERKRLSGFLRRPTREQIRSLGSMQYLNLTDDEITALEPLIEEILTMMDRLDDIQIPELAVRHRERDSGYRPTPNEDPYNVFIRKCLVKGAASGKLAGKRVGLKDNLRVAGVPMTNGSNLVGQYIPHNDATVVERLLDAGATIVGKLNMDDFSMTGTGESSVYGCARNPRNPAFSPGGSSGGAAAAVAAGEVDIALGVDQGGSGRIPAAWCGVIALKATHGLIPTFGLAFLDHTIDFITPTAQTTRDVALTLEAIAGADDKDPQWVRGPIPVEAYSQALIENVTDVRIGVVNESFDWPFAERDVNDAVHQGVKKLRELGASCQEVSIPWWHDAWAIWTGFATHSIMAMIESDLEGYWRGGICDVDWQRAFGAARRVHSDELPPRFKVLMIVGKYLQREYFSTYYSKAQNIRFAFARQIDELLQDVDVLLTPTVPVKAFPLLDRILSPTELANRGPSTQGGTPLTPANTCAANVTGHPALTIPCGVGENGLPIGLQLIGRRFEESLLFRVAFTFEKS